jgi:hypothetical protein
MKLRIKGNSMRLRVSPSEMKRLLSDGRIEEIIRFGSEPDAKLTYALEQAASNEQIAVRYRPQEVTVVLSTQNAATGLKGTKWESMASSKSGTASNSQLWSRRTSPASTG